MIVRHGDHAVELRLGHTTASFYRRGEPMTGTVWDLCAWPVLAFDDAPSVLVLGLGGGTMARAIRHLAPASRITGVELDAEVIEVARRELALDELGVEVVVESAEIFLARDERRFDLIVDDVFTAVEGALEKPASFRARWEELVLPRLAPSGLVAVNTLGDAVLEDTLRRRCSHLLAARCLDAHNRVLVGSDRSLERLREALREHPSLAALRSNCVLCEGAAPLAPSNDSPGHHSPSLGSAEPAPPRGTAID